MLINETIKSALKQLLSNKGRTILTMLGMFIGVGAVIMILALGNGFQKYIKDSFLDMGLGVFTVQAKENKPEHQIDVEDLEVIKSFEEIKSIARGNDETGTLVNKKGESFKCSISGIEPVYLNEISPLDLVAGRNLSENDEKTDGSSVVIADVVAKALFGAQDYAKIIGEQLEMTINKQPASFQIIGIYETSTSKDLSKKELESYISRKSFYIPYSKLDQMLGLGGKVKTIAGNIKDGYDQSEVTTKIGQILNKRHHLKDGYTITTYVQIIQMVDSIMTIITLFVSALASISLVVGGVGIMNIMLVTVKERTREIGIRKALGASNKAILFQFLIEALMLTLIAGILGMLLGYIGAIIIGSKFGIMAQFSIGMILFATLTSVAIGIVFGVYPAYQAARLDPIEALRAE